LPTAVALAACAAIALAPQAPPAVAATDGDLAARLATASAVERIPVLVTLRAQVDGEDYAGRPGALLAALRRTARTTQGGVVEDVDAPVTRFWLVNALATTATPDEIRALAADPAVERVSADRPVRVADAAVRQADTFPDAGQGDWGLAAMRVPEVWSATGLTGRGVRLGSIDTGVDAGHPDLRGKVVAWRDFVSGRPEPYDDNGHGTHTVGTMVGGRAGGGAIGVAPDARVLVAKAIGAGGSGPGTALMSAAQWMADPDGDPATADQPVAVNNSWSAEDANDPWFRSIIRRWTELGIVPVFAAGNTGPGAGTVGSPAGYPEALAVGAHGESGGLASFSSQGPVVWRDLDGTGPAAGTVLTKPDVAAPGVNITSSVDSGYLSFSGTSMASPHVAGLVALLAQADPEVRGARAADVVRAAAVDAGASGPDSRYGAGRVDAVRAVQSVLGPAAVAAPPQTRFLTRPPRATRRTAVLLKVAATGGEGYRWRVNGGAWSGVTTAGAVRVPLGRGRNVLEAQAVATAAVDASPARAVVVVDRTPPRLSFTWRTRSSRTVFTARAVDRQSSVRSLRWRLGDGGTATGASVRHRFRGSGARRVRLVAADAAGNVAAVSRVVRVP
jgi:subtilisin family serine protease